MSKHQYKSTACWHRHHDRCRQVCKFCESPCSCLCHDERFDHIHIADQGCVFRGPLGVQSCH